MREAILYVNGATPGSQDLTSGRIQGTLGQNDAIVFASSLNGGVITITGGNLILSKRATITGPENGVLIQKGTSSTATVGLTFQNFDLNPIGLVSADTGVSRVQVADFDIGIRLVNLTSTSFDVEHPFRIIDNRISNVITAIAFNNADVPFHIESNVLLGRSTTSGSGIDFFDSGQFTPSGTNPIRNLPIQPTIGNFDVGAGNVMGGFLSGIHLVNSSFPDLRISGNLIGANVDLNGNLQAIPNGKGIELAFVSYGTEVDRIDNNSILYNNGDGIIIQVFDEILIENNLIGASGGDGIDLSIASGSHVIRNNTFDGNGGDGVTIHPVSSGTEAQQIEITANHFLGIETGDQPIDLKSDGPTGNDESDIDEDGPNRLQNFPVIDDATLNGDIWTVDVSLDTQTGDLYRLEFYRVDPLRGNYVFIGSDEIDVPANGEFSESYPFIDKVELGDGDQIAAIAIGRSGFVVGNTSELSSESLSSILAEDGPPQIVDVRMLGSTWASGVAYSYADVDQDGDQLRPIFMQGIDIVEIQFSEDVTIGNGLNQLAIRTSSFSAPPQIASFSYDAITRRGIWILSAPLAVGKYALELTDLTTVDDANKGLDGDWENLLGSKADDFADDPVTAGNTFPSGNGVAGSPNNRFEFYFSVLPGDYNQDGLVNGDDLQPGVVKDGDGDGQLEAGETDHDYLVAANVAYANSYLPFRKNMGDYVDDDIVDGFVTETNALLAMDYGKWKSTYGYTPPDDEADGNLNGVVDTADYINWRTFATSWSAWYTGPVPGGGGSEAPEFVQIGQAPRVINVVVSGSQSTHAPYSFDAHDGSGEQLRTVPVGGADTISITFSEDVNVMASNLRLAGLRKASEPTIVEFGYDIGTMTATWRFDDLVASDHYLISLSDAVTDVEGNPLDGEWVNPATLSTTNGQVSVFPSGNEEAGGSFNFVMTLYAGDANLDLYVDSADASILGWNYNILFGMLFIDGDFNGDGAVDASDFGMLGGTYGSNLASLSMLADLDGDLAVDDDDLQVISDNYGMSNATWADGDLNGDGYVEFADLELAFAQYGLELAVVS
ncbi:MAG: right-handed parallel beta-helix repeat-containing protein [Pirellulales bacterium]